MLFLKPKPRPNELLPPPPPFPNLDFDEKPKPGPVMAEMISEDRFEHLFKDVEDINPKTINGKTTQKIKTFKLKQNQIKIKGLKDKLKTKQNSSDYSQDDLEDLNYDLSKDIETDDYIKKDLKSRPKELAEAEDEIKTAIEKIKEHEKPSLFGSLFRSKKPEPEMEMPIQEIAEDNVSKIMDKITNARQSLMNLDLQKARGEYLEIMKAYNELKPEEQRKVFYEIKNLYYERKSAESLKFQ